MNKCIRCGHKTQLQHLHVDGIICMECYHYENESNIETVVPEELAALAGGFDDDVFWLQRYIRGAAPLPSP